MRIQPTAITALVFASGVPAGSAFSAFTAPAKAGSGARPKSSRGFAQLQSTGTALYTVTDSKSDTINGEVEDKAWKIIKEHSEEEEPVVASSNSTAVNDAIEAVEAEIKAVEESSTDVTVNGDQEEKVRVTELEKALAQSEPEVKPQKVESPTILDELDLVKAVEEEAMNLVDEMVAEMSDECEIDDEGNAADELCVDESKLRRLKSKFKGVVGKTLGLVRTGGGDDLSDSASAPDEFQIIDFDDDNVPEGELLERGWEKRGNSNALRRNAEVWKFALSCVFKALKPKKLRKGGASEEEIQEAKTEAATFIRNGLLRLGPSFVKLGQVVSTRTDVLPIEYTDVLKTLQDDVPGFSGKRAKGIVSQELGRPCDEVFQNFSEEPLAAASLGQVHTATYKGKKVAIKVQRAGLKELFDVDLKNLKKLAALLDKFDPKTDGADRNWVSIYEESERLLYEEINYIKEADNADRFSKDFVDTDWVRVPGVYREITTPRVLSMEYVESFKLTDLERVKKEGLDSKLLAKRTADSFLRQIVETGYFHCDPHPGNLCVDTKGNLVFYDYGMMDELKPNVRSGFRKFCTALFAGGPTIDDLELAKNAKMLVDGVEEAGVLAKGADRLAVEKLARFFMRSFKDKQLGKTGSNIKTTIGNDLQTLTENNVFRFPSTFTFIFRSFASIDGIGKGLDPDYDIGKLAQPFIEKFTDAQAGYGSKAQKNLSIFQKATGLNNDDINSAVTSPRKIAYMEETMRSMESGSLKIRVRSLENEKALERMALTQERMESLLLTSLFVNIGGIAAGPIFSAAGFLGAANFGFKAFMANTKIKKFDKTQSKFVQTKFVDDE